MAKPRLSPLFSWRGAICESDLHSTTRLVALVLSLHMSERGDSCFPSQARLAHETGLQPRAVRKHLALLRSERWLNVRYEHRSKGTKAFYSATVPLAEAEWCDYDPPA